MQSNGRSRPMKYGFRLFSLFIGVMILSGVFPVSGATAAPGPLHVKGSEGLKKAKWTVMVYLDADNNLEDAGVEDLNEMEMVGSTLDVNIVVLMDRAEGYDTSNGDWEGARIYEVVKDQSGGGKITSKLIADLGEVNMGEPDTLVNFTLWAAERYPAEHYLLDIWDHGGAFLGAAWDDSEEDKEAGIPADNLNLYNLTEALAKIKAGLGRNVDVLGFDACLMGAVSVLYSLYGYADYVVASGPVEPGDGWPYEIILKDIADNPDMPPREVAERIVKDYVESYRDFEEDPTDSPKVTQAAWDMEKMPEVFLAVNALAGELAKVSAPPPKGHSFDILRARAKTHSYDVAAVGGVDLMASYTMYDLYDLAGRLLEDRTLPSSLLFAADWLRESLLNANVASSAGILADMSEILGLSVYFPTGERNVPFPFPDPSLGPASKYSRRYDDTLWSEEQFWDDFLKYYWDPHVNAEITPPAIMVESEPVGYSEPFHSQSIVLKGKTMDIGSGREVSLKTYVSVNGGEWHGVRTSKNGEWCIEVGSTGWKDMGASGDRGDVNYPPPDVVETGSADTPGNGGPLPGLKGNYTSNGESYLIYNISVRAVSGDGTGEGTSLITRYLFVPLEEDMEPVDRDVGWVYGYLVFSIFAVAAGGYALKKYGLLNRFNVFKT